MTEISPGSLVLARTAHDSWVHMRATTGVTQGMDFPVVWLVEAQQWIDALPAPGDAPQGIPWPADEVQTAEEDGS